MKLNEATALVEDWGRNWYPGRVKSDDVKRAEAFLKDHESEVHKSGKMVVTNSLHGVERSIQSAIAAIDRHQENLSMKESLYSCLAMVQVAIKNNRRKPALKIK